MRPRDLFARAHLRSSPRLGSGIRFAKRVHVAGDSSARVERLWGTMKSCDFDTPFEEVTPVPDAPRISANLSSVPDLIEATIDDRAAERPVYSLVVEGQTCEGVDLSRLELFSSHLLRCTFLASDLSNATFEDVAFEQCDFSNADISSAYFLRCSFSSCRFVGADFSGTVFKHATVTDSTFQYASFTRGGFDACSFEGCDFSQASIAEAELKRVEFSQSRLTNVDFFKTSLRGIDLSDNDIAGFLVSDTMRELSGCIMDPYQAASVARKLGIVVKE